MRSLRLHNNTIGSVPQDKDANCIIEKSGVSKSYAFSFTWQKKKKKMKIFTVLSDFVIKRVWMMPPQLVDGGEYTLSVACVAPGGETVPPGKNKNTTNVRTVEHGGFPRRESLPVSSSLWGEEGGSAQHQKPGEGCIRGTDCCNDSPSTTPHCRIKSNALLLNSSSSSEVTQHHQLLFGPTLQRWVFIKPGSLECACACVCARACVSEWVSECVFSPPPRLFLQGILSSSLLSTTAPLASPKVRRACTKKHLHEFPLWRPDLCWKIDAEEGFNWKIGFPLRKHVVSAPSYHWCSWRRKKKTMIWMRRLSRAASLHISWKRGVLHVRFLSVGHVLALKEVVHSKLTWI